MGLKELIETYKDMSLDEVAVDKVFDDLHELECIYKPKNLPQYVADWYEKNKDNFEYRLWEWFNHRSINCATENSEFYMWLNNSFNNPVETLVKMKLFGYKVNKEKLYFVKVKGVYKSSNTLNYYADEDRWVFVDDIEAGSHRTKHTKKQLEDAGFEWVFNCPGIEVEEVQNEA